MEIVTEMQIEILESTNREERTKYTNNEEIIEPIIKAEYRLICK
jgi:hypothetical protein